MTWKRISSSTLDETRWNWSSTCNFRLFFGKNHFSANKLTEHLHSRLAKFLIATEFDIPCNYDEQWQMQYVLHCCYPNATNRNLERNMKVIISRKSGFSRLTFVRSVRASFSVQSIVTDAPKYVCVLTNQSDSFCCRPLTSLFVLVNVMIVQIILLIAHDRRANNPLMFRSQLSCSSKKSLATMATAKSSSILSWMSSSLHHLLK